MILVFHQSRAITLLERKEFPLGDCGCFMPNDFCVMIVVHIIKDGNVMVQYACLANMNNLVGLVS